MNDGNVENARASTRCYVCKLPTEALAALHHDRFQNGMGFETLARKYAQPERSLSESGVRRHFARHVPEPVFWPIPEAETPANDPRSSGKLDLERPIALRADHAMGDFLALTRLPATAIPTPPPRHPHLAHYADLVLERQNRRAERRRRLGRRAARRRRQPRHQPLSEGHPGLQRDAHRADRARTCRGAALTVAELKARLDETPLGE